MDKEVDITFDNVEICEKLPKNIDKRFCDTNNTDGWIFNISDTINQKN